MAARGCRQPEGRRSRQRKAAGCCQAQGTQGPCGPPQPQLPQDRLPGPGPPGLRRRESRELPAASDSLSMLCSFQLLAHADVGEDDSGALHHLQRLLKHPNQVMYSLVLSALLPASETPVMVSRAHFCEGRWVFVLKVSWPAPGQLGGLCSARSSVAQKKWPRNELAMEGPSGSLGSFPCMPCTSWGGSEKGAQSLCSAALLFLVLPLREQDGSLVPWHHRLLARVAFHRFTKRKLCPSSRQENFPCCCQASFRACRLPGLTAR